MVIIVEGCSGPKTLRLIERTSALSPALNAMRLSHGMSQVRSAMQGMGMLGSHPSFQGSHELPG